MDEEISTEAEGGQLGVHPRDPVGPAQGKKPEDDAERGCPPIGRELPKRRDHPEGDEPSEETSPHGRARREGAPDAEEMDPLLRRAVRGHEG